MPPRHPPRRGRDHCPAGRSHRRRAGTAPCRRLRPLRGGEDRVEVDFSAPRHGSVAALLDSYSRGAARLVPTDLADEFAGLVAEDEDLPKDTASRATQEE